MNRKPFGAEQESEYPNHSQEGNHGTESGLSRWDGGNILCEIESVDGAIQR